MKCFMQHPSPYGKNGNASGRMIMLTMVAITLSGKPDSTISEGTGRFLFVSFIMHPSQSNVHLA